MTGNVFALPSVHEVIQYLTTAGWNEGPTGPAGSFWRKNGSTVAVPRVGGEHMLPGVVERVAAAEGISAERAATVMRQVRVDVTDLVATGSRDDSIPLDTASSAATTARQERAQIAGNYSRVGDQVVREMRMGHTRSGSFVIPILVTLSAPLVPSQPLILSESTHRALAPEPFERRVTRTFAQSLQAVRDIIVSPARVPSSDDLRAAVEVGLSREFCQAVAKVLLLPAVAQFRATFSWAPAVPSRTESPGTSSWSRKPRH